MILFWIINTPNDFYSFETIEIKLDDVWKNYTSVRIEYAIDSKSLYIM